VRFDPGIGSERFERARAAVRAAPGGVGLAAFTFDEDEPGSVVIVPETLLEVDPAGARLRFGDMSAIPGQREIPALPRGRVAVEDGDAWIVTVAAALGAIGRGEVEKVVISRTVELDFDTPVPLEAVAARLADAQGGSHTFMIDGLVGSSPELLVAKQGDSVRSLSLAGSADGASPMAAAWLETPKMAMEHNLAADSVEDALAPFCVALSREPTTVKSYADIAHLATAFVGEALPGTQVMDLVAALHPTAAVAGTPTKAAVELIREIEPHGRGRYAGPVGWLDANGDGEFAIALRCGVVTGREVLLFTGVGLVPGSDSTVEYEETRIKLRPMLRALGVS
jgi:menaquinone-specific isochorismate synthase